MTADRSVVVVSEGLLTIPETARFLSVSRGHVYKLMDSGELPFVKLGRCRRVPRRAVVELAASRVQGGER